MNDTLWPPEASGRGRKRLARLRPWVVIAAPVAAILFQVYLPLYLPLLQNLELSLLVVIYLAIARRNPISGALIGTVVGLVQDALSHQPIGIFGMVKTMVGYGAAALGVRFDTGHTLVRLGLVFVMFLCHQALYWTARQFLLGAPSGAELLPALLAAAANALLSIPLYHLLDKLKDRGQ
ncbi:MAG: rod shape-determining protein MreD [Bryobacterales bacterium]|nr:rod shape-determining protein MreD [Bryobacterales bacterium]